MLFDPIPFPYLFQNSKRNSLFHLPRILPQSADGWDMIDWSSHGYEYTLDYGLS